MAERVGPDGVSAGIDISPDMIGQARLRTGSLPANFLWADAASLPFQDAAFAACRTERTLQHVHALTAVLGEVWRVLRDEGRFVAAEPDWTTTTVVPDQPAVGRLILDEWGTFNPNPAIGANLAALLPKAGFSVGEIVGRSAIYRSFKEANVRYPLERAAAHAAKEALVPTQDAEAWIDNLKRASADHAFLFSVTIFIVEATKPSP
jgi:SAM-dependent methyltransferase